MWKKDYTWNPATCSCENSKYFACTTIDGSVIKCDEIIKDTKTVPMNFNEKNGICKTKTIYILPPFLSSTIALLIAVSIYCYLIQYKPKQKHFLSYYVTNNKLKRVLY